MHRIIKMGCACTAWHAHKPGANCRYCAADQDASWWVAISGLRDDSLASSLGPSRAVLFPMGLSAHPVSLPRGLCTEGFARSCDSKQESSPATCARPSEILSTPHANWSCGIEDPAKIEQCSHQYLDTGQAASAIVYNAHAFLQPLRCPASI
jgi:hypothetical protein